MKHWQESRGEVFVATDCGNCFIDQSVELRWESALDFLGSMSSARCMPDTISCTAAMNACAKDPQKWIEQLKWAIGICLLHFGQ